MRCRALPSLLHASAGAWGRSPAPRANKKQQKEGTTGKQSQEALLQRPARTNADRDDAVAASSARLCHGFHHRSRPGLSPLMSVGKKPRRWQGKCLNLILAFPHVQRELGLQPTPEGHPNNFRSLPTPMAAPALGHDAPRAQTPRCHPASLCKVSTCPGLPPSQKKQSRSKPDV